MLTDRNLGMELPKVPAALQEDMADLPQMLTAVQQAIRIRVPWVT